MNKFRLSQILEILTFPYTDINLIGEDALAKREEAYCEFVDNTEIFNMKKRGTSSRQYEQAHRKFGKYLCMHCSGTPKSLDDVLMIGEKFFSHNRIMEYMSHTWEGVDRKDMVNQCYIDNIFWIAYSLLTLRDGVIAIRTWKTKFNKEFPEDILGTNEAFDKVEIWNSLMRIVTPDLFIAAFVAINGGKLDMLYQQGANISLADKLLMVNLERGIAETHMHINVSSDYLILWERVMNLAVWKEYIPKSGEAFGDYDTILCHISVYRCMTAYFLEGFAKEDTYKDFLTKTFPEVIQCMQQPEQIRWRTGGEKRLSFTEIERKWSTFFGNIDVVQMRKKDILYSILYEKYEIFDTSGEFIFLTKALNYIRENQDMEFAKLFLQYIRIKNTYFEKIFERDAVQGLNWFQEYFSRASGVFRRGMTKEMRWDYILKTQLNIKSLKKLEFRMSVDTDIKFRGRNDELAQLELQKEILKEIGKFLTNYKKYIHGREEVPTIGIVLHFKKQKSLDNISGFFCWRLIDDAQLYDTQHKIALRRKYVNIAKAIAVIRNEIPYLDEYLVGLDAAADENAAEPWLFAPAYNEVRSRKHTDGVKACVQREEVRYKRINNIGLTYHVGEDYRHILSGLRHIDEVIEKYNYRTCDRIGHGIALGADVEYWVKNNRNVMIPVGEYLDNLLWVWGIVIENKNELPVSAYALEGKILETASRIYSNMNGITVHVLYQAYQGKFRQDFTKEFQRYNNDMVKRDKEIVFPEDEGVCKYGMYKDRKGAELWNASKIICTYFCAIYEDKYNQVIWLETTGEDAKLLKALQNYMVEKIQKRGIYIETNPTSNLAIGEIESLYGHYITNLNELGAEKPKHNVMVTINSDDPMVFNTNVENELAYMYHGAISAGYDSRTTLEWIDKIRQYGLESSFIRKIKTVEEMETEIGIIEKEIENFLKR